MGQKELGRSHVSGLSESFHGVSELGCTHAVCVYEEGLSQSPVPGDLIEGPIRGWDNVWVDLGGEG